MYNKEKLNNAQKYSIYVAIFIFMMFCHTMYNYSQRLYLQHQEDYVTVKATRVTQLQYVDENGNKFGGKYFLPTDYFSYNKNDPSYYFETLYGIKLFLPLVFLIPACMVVYAYNINDQSVSRLNKEREEK